MHTEFTEQGMRAGFQIGLLDLWDKSRQTDHLPNFRSFPFDRFIQFVDHLMCSDVQYSNGTPDFIILFHGEGFTRSYGRRCHGRPLKEVLPEAIRARTLFDYETVALTKLPRFSSNPVTGADGVTVQYQRLLLPFTIWDKTTDRIICAVHLTPENGRAVPHGLFSVAEED